MIIKIIFIGDIVGKIGRETVNLVLPNLKKKYKPDIIIANAENLAHGKGVTIGTIDEMKKAGISLFTSGNHIWKTKDADKLLIEKDISLLRPLNYPPMVPGIGYKEIKIGNTVLLVLNIMGRVFMKESLDCPFRAVDRLLDKLKTKKDYKNIIVDFHAEATSEKVAMKYYLDGRVSAVLGTHTHITTADEQITEKGTAYITDIGAVLAKDSIIGVKIEPILKSFIWQISQQHDIPEFGLGEFNGVYLEIDSDSGKATVIKRIRQEVNIKNK